MNKFDFGKALPYEATHAGDLIKDEITARGISLSGLAEITGIQKAVLNDIVCGRRTVSPGLALMFEDALGIPATLLLNVQTQYRMDCARMEWARRGIGAAVGRTLENAQPV